MFGKIFNNNKRFKGIPALVLCLAMIVTAVPVYALDGTSAEDDLLYADDTLPATNTDNAFIIANNGYDGLFINGNYGSESLSVALIDRERDRFIIDLNGKTLTLGYLALNMDLELRGEGTLSVAGGIVVYSGELYLGDGVRVVSDASIPVIAHGSDARVRIGEGVSISGENAVAEFGFRYEYKENPIVFEGLPEEAGGTYGVDRFRVLYENCFGADPSVAIARVAEFPTEEDAAAALERGVITVVNRLDGTETESADDDSFLKVSGNALTVGKSGAVLSHANLSLDGALGVNLYFELSGLEGTVDSLGALVYSGVGNGGRIEIPAKNSDGKYRFRVPISPMDMTKTITVGFEDDPTGKTWEYSVERYARYILEDTEGVYGTAIKDLIASMLNYGSAMQRLNGESEGLAGDILSDYPEYADEGKLSKKIADAVDWLRASGYAYSELFYSNGDSTHVRFERVSIAVNEITAIRLYLRDGYAGDGLYSYQLSYRNTAENGAVYEKTEELSFADINQNGYVEIAGIPAGDFHRVFRVSVTDRDGVIAYCETTVFDYAMRLYELSEAGTAERGLAEALIWYGARSVSYFGRVS